MKMLALVKKMVELVAAVVAVVVVETWRAMKKTTVELSYLQGRRYQ